MIERCRPADRRTRFEDAVRGERKIDEASFEEIAKAINLPNGAGCGRGGEREYAESGE